MLGMMSEGLADELEVYISTNPDKSLLPKKQAQRNRTLSGRRLQEKVIMGEPDSAIIYTCWSHRVVCLWASHVNIFTGKKETKDLD